MTRTGTSRLPARLVGALAVVVLCCAGAGVADAAPRASRHQPVLGKKHLFEPYGKGWGTYRPAAFDNGGDPSGFVDHVTWTHWGSTKSVGHGLTSGPRPNGGYYSKPVKIRLHASDLGHCTPGGPLAYEQLHVSVQKKPGSSHYTRYFSWAGLKSICKRTYQNS